MVRLEGKVPGWCGGLSEGRLLWTNSILTSIYYKETDSHSYLNFKWSHPSNCKSAIPYSKFLRLRKICSEDDDFEESANTIETFFVARGYPIHLVRDGRTRAT